MSYYRRLFLVLAIVPILAVGLSYKAAHAAADGQYFPETQHIVAGLFLQYWNGHGGLAQQGYPLSEQFQEKSATDGKTYTVQYFERAVFELHPENVAPNNVLLSLLGNFLYNQKYPNGAPAQTVNTEAGAQKFAETGHTVGGKFLTYWQQHGGLAQQGYPISEEFQEKSALDGKTYTVQYFERAVFEAHPENPAPYDVLLSQLGKFQLNGRYPNNSNPAAKAVLGAFDPPGVVLLAISPGMIKEANQIGNFKPAQGDKFVLVYVQVANYSGAKANLDDDCCRVRDSKGRTYPIDLDKATGHDPNDIQREAANEDTQARTGGTGIYSGYVQPGEGGVDEVYVFEVSQDATGLELYIPSE